MAGCDATGRFRGITGAEGEQAALQGVTLLGGLLCATLGSLRPIFMASTILALAHTLRLAAQAAAADATAGRSQAAAWGPALAAAAVCGMLSLSPEAREFFFPAPSAASLPPPPGAEMSEARIEVKEGSIRCFNCLRSVRR
eukprot:CAMPEP_0173398536 /NCGR_PEP_ID=MMETSP1356-20130122/41926_1 /TAXON_ID=77927 ORGANISM="Hemiselmis virescens, Strain PCC157" /NCGR_SAMPLE_ID=MMETSP1356 /ASSEMBLY_ACC=CAM_ASM_000847 /LENGTH=140 /DNA_ID=CAMNT_0014358043 /DNA_START=66 /DNA_END=484 /DNA_ORIENTATION=+